MKPRIKPWTDEENEQLTRLAADGASPARAAALLARKIVSIQNHARKLGIRFPTLEEQRKKLGATRLSKLRS